MKIEEQIKPCDNCGGPIGPTFYEIEVNAYLVDYGAISRYMGLQMMMGGSKALADVFTPESQFADKFGSHKKTLCMNCYAKASEIHAVEGIVELKENDDART
jgi:hypothetical protein